MASLLRQGRLLAAIRSARTPVTPYPGGTGPLIKVAATCALPARLVDAVVTRFGFRRNVPDWLNQRWFDDRDVQPVSRWTAAGRHVMREMLGHNLVESRIQALMRYEDRNAMAVSVENRVPFLSVPLVELLFSLPEDYLLAPDGTRKAVFRKAMRGIVPDSILDRRDKIGFSVPIAAWFEALRPWMSDRLSLAAALPCLEGPRVDLRRMALMSNRSWGDPHLMWRLVSVATWIEQTRATLDA
jgi:asparagine synthase (glutamine-hydrolysing)